MSEQNTDQAVEKKPNVVFIGKQRKFNEDKDDYELVPRPVPKFVKDGKLKIELPEYAEYGKGFYSEHSVRLTQLPDFLPFQHKDQPETDLPANFPFREILRGLALQTADVEKMSREDLIKLPKIGEVSADKILEFLQKGAE